MGFREQYKLERFIKSAPDFVRVEVLATIPTPKGKLPIYGIVIGPEDKSLPTFGLFGGVHGLEKIGSHVVINHLKYLSKQLKWDGSLVDIFKQSRLVSIPIVNPGGMCFNRRSNLNGVDVMRNAPVEADAQNWNPVSGHFLGKTLPWYRGNPQKMELETKTLVDFVQREMFEAEFAMTIDVHSGFGMQDRLWFPYSKTSDPFPYFDEVSVLKSKFNESLPHNHYIIEPQNEAYMINGDPWDFLFDMHHEKHHTRTKFIPWTLELGSWIWVRKNPMQAFGATGFFNPIRPHRYDRIMRRHRFLIDFFHRMTTYHQNWLPQAKETYSSTTGRSN